MCNPAHSPLDRPLHGLVCNKHWHGNVEDLVTGAAEGVEDGGLTHTGQCVQSVIRDSVMHDTLLWHGA